ncbi:MAG: TIR domain-containing protein [Symploca sp. SIO1B1]|nr:TIR domain-containing protein [Symploca sp. SIO1B1]
MNETFISYSPQDSKFVRRIVDALNKAGINTWFEMEDIRPTTKWTQEILLGVQTCHNFVFIISPDSIASPYCEMELNYALLHNKRLIPVLYKHAEGIPPVLREPSWIFFHNFSQGMEDLLLVIESTFGASLGNRLDAVIFIETQGTHSRSFFLYRNHYLVGRNPKGQIGNTGIILINDKYVSRSHLELKLDAGKWHAVDCHSRNGCSINGGRLREGQSKLLRHGDRIMLSPASKLIYEEIQPKNWVVNGNERETTPERVEQFPATC